MSWDSLTFCRCPSANYAFFGCPVVNFAYCLSHGWQYGTSTTTVPLQAIVLEGKQKAVLIPRREAGSRGGFVDWSSRLPPLTRMGKNNLILRFFGGWAVLVPRHNFFRFSTPLCCVQKGEKLAFNSRKTS